MLKMSNISPKRINEKGLIAQDLAYTEKGFVEFFDHFSEDAKSKILLQLYHKQSKSKQLKFLEKNNATKTQWDWLKYKLDNYWLTLVKKGVDTKVWKYVNKSVKELQKQGFDIRGRCGKCNLCIDFWYNKGDNDCINPVHKNVRFHVERKSGPTICFEHNFYSGIDEGYIDKVSLYDFNGFPIGRIKGHESNGKEWISAEEKGINLLKYTNEFDKFISEFK